VLSDGSSAEVGWVVNCTGPRSDVRTLANPLLDDLLRERPGGALATVATAGMGLRTLDGRVRGADGEAASPLWTLGALRRGELWESTAVPEIRAQAAEVARAVAGALSPGRSRAVVPDLAAARTRVLDSGPRAARLG
jgi:uncharacterized NAD(P)/FAD-binding protein YdhS